MKTRSRFLSSKLLILSCMVLSLGACQTMQGIKKDFDTIKIPKLGLSSQNEEPDQVQQADLRIDNNCPYVEIVDELSSFSEFSGSSSSESNLISRVTLNQVESSCDINNNQITLDLKLSFEGALGPKAKRSSNDKPFFSYPFFVAVTNPSNVILAKEVFAASMTYERKEKTHNYFENIRHIIPINNKSQASKYKVMIGFQLGEDQLKYNRKYMVPKG